MYLKIQAQTKCEKVDPKCLWRAPVSSKLRSGEARGPLPGGPKLKKPIKTNIKSMFLRCSKNALAHLQDALFAPKSSKWIPSDPKGAQRTPKCLHFWLIFRCFFALFRPWMPDGVRNGARAPSSTQKCSKIYAQTPKSSLKAIRGTRESLSN